MRVFVNVAAAYASWFAVAWLAAGGAPLVAVLPSLAAVALHLVMSPVAERRGEARLALMAGLVGLGVETLHSGLGFVRYGDALLWGVAPPLFMIAVWMAFSTMLNVSLGWLQARPLLAAGCGALGGAASYYAGARIGAIGIGEPVAFGLLGIGLIWAVAFPLLLAVARRTGHQPRS